GVEGEADPGLGRAAGDHVPHPVLVRVPGNAAVEGEAHGIDDRALARPGRADEGDVVDVGEVDDRRLPEGAEAGHLQPDRSHRPAPAGAGAEDPSRGTAVSSSSRRAKRASSRGSATFWPARYSANSSWGVRPARRDASAAASSASSSWTTRTSTASGNSSRTSSASPDRAGSATKTRRKSSPVVPARAASSATVPVSVRSRRPAVSGTRSTVAGTSGDASTSSTPGWFSVSPKSSWRGDPQ